MMRNEIIPAGSVFSVPVAPRIIDHSGVVMIQRCERVQQYLPSDWLF